MKRRALGLILPALFLLLLGPGATTVFAMDATDVAVNVSIENQFVNDARVLVNTVNSFGPAWLAIHTVMANGDLGPVIGYAAVPDGLSMWVTVAIDMKKAAKSLVAVLHVDRGVVGMFDYPDGEDQPAKAEGQVVEASFTASY